MTGATGLVGSHLVERLCAENKRVRVLVRKTSERDWLKSLAAEIWEGDLNDPAGLAAAAAGCSRIFHCAALVTDWAKREDYHAVNVAGTENLLAAACSAGIKRLIHLSSCDVYGNPGRDNVTEEWPRITGQHPYGDSKIAGEKLVEKYRERGLETVILRPATIYGPRSRMLVGTLAGLIKQRRLVLVNHGRAGARLCYVGNLVEAMLLAAGHPGAVGEVYNVGDGSRVTWREFFDRIAQAINAPPPRFSLPYPLAYLFACGAELAARLPGKSGRPLATRYLCRMMGIDQYFSIEKIKSELGFVPRVGFADGMEKTAEWLYNFYSRPS